MNCFQRHSFFAWSLKCSLVLLYNSSWSFTKSTIASSSESVRQMLVMCPFLYRDCDGPASPPASVSVSILSVWAFFPQLPPLTIVFPPLLHRPPSWPPSQSVAVVVPPSSLWPPSSVFSTGYRCAPPPKKKKKKKILFLKHCRCNPSDATRFKMMHCSN